MSASNFILIPLSTYNAKDFLNDFTKLPYLLMFQKVFSMQISSAVGIKRDIMCENSNTVKKDSANQ